MRHKLEKEQFKVLQSQKKHIGLEEKLLGDDLCDGLQSTLWPVVLLCLRPFLWPGKLVSSQQATTLDLTVLGFSWFLLVFCGSREYVEYQSNRLSIV